MSIKVSIIVPVYNSESYLCRCLDSLVNQSLEEIEIILINDCSTDNSLEILERYKRLYKDKIIIVNLEKKLGPGGARNAGINIASGEYIGFVDSDDDVELEMYKELYKLANTGSYDMVDCSFYFEVLDRNMKTTDDKALGELNLEKRRELFVHAGFIWSKIIKRDILVKNDIRFRENVAFEDIDFIRIAMLYCNKINATDKILYNHRNNEGSITNEHIKEVHIYQKMDCIRTLVSKLKEFNIYEDYKDEVTYLIYKTYVIMLQFIIATESDDFKVESFKELQDFFFELVKHDYHNNQYILQLDEKDRNYAEINNKDCYLTILYAIDELINC